MGTIPDADQELVHVRIGDASGWRHHGRERAIGSAGNSEGHQGSGLTMSALTQTKSRDIVIIGGGHNGLVTAFYLAKAGYKPLVLERSAQVGGAAVTDEFHPGFRCSTLAHTAGPIRPEIVRDMQLDKHGLKWITPEVCVTALSPDGRALSLYQDAKKSAQEITAFSQKDAAKYLEFQQSLGKIAKVIGEALATTPPDIDHPSRGDLWSMLQTGRAIRKLGKRDMFRLLRWGPIDRK